MRLTRRQRTVPASRITCCLTTLTAGLLPLPACARPPSSTSRQTTLPTVRIAQRDQPLRQRVMRVRDMRQHARHRAWVHDSKPPKRQCVAVPRHAPCSDRNACDAGDVSWQPSAAAAAAPTLNAAAARRHTAVKSSPASVMPTQPRPPPRTSSDAMVATANDVYSRRCTADASLSVRGLEGLHST